MTLSDKQKAFLKKLAIWLFRLPGYGLFLFLLWLASEFLYASQMSLYGPFRFLNGISVYGALGDFFYNNRGGMSICSFRIVSLIVVAAALITAWGVQKAKFFKKLKFVDKWLIAALIYAVAAIVFTATALSAAYSSSGKFYTKVRKCQTISDYEKLCGKAVWQKTVDEKDSEFVNAIAKFEKSGFKAGRNLHIFKYSKPEVYPLIWSENGKIVHRNWCHQSAADQEKVKGL